MNTKKVVEILFWEYIKGTRAEAIVTNVTSFLCHLPNGVKVAMELPSSKVYVTTRMIKHLYDAKPAEEFHFVVDNLLTLIRCPDEIYLNRGSKRASFCILKKVKGEYYFCPLEIVNHEEELAEEKLNGLYVVTAFRLRRKQKDKYLRNYKLVWRWRDDVSSS